MLDVSDIGALLSEHGISTDEPVFIYDDGKYLDAARLFWVLEVHGHPSVHIIEGGIKRWELLGYSLDATPNAPRDAKSFVPIVQPNSLSTTEDVYRSIDMPDVIILDARPKEEWRGLTSKTHIKGHIPSAKSQQWCNFLLISNDKQEAGKAPNESWCTDPGLMPGEWLKLSNSADIGDLIGEQDEADSRVITYCNRGKQSAVVYLALRQAGLDVSAYDGSWIEWSRHPDLPVASPQS